jgi:hypothetical protein
MADARAPILELANGDPRIVFRLANQSGLNYYSILAVVIKKKRPNPHAVALGREGGKSRSPAKLAAIKTNAQKAGRKPKFGIGDNARVNDNGPSDYRHRLGFVTELGPGKNEYRVEFEDGKTPTTGYLMSWWLDREQ